MSEPAPLPDAAASQEGLGGRPNNPADQITNLQGPLNLEGADAFTPGGALHIDTTNVGTPGDKVGDFDTGRYAEQMERGQKITDALAAGAGQPEPARPEPLPPERPTPGKPLNNAEDRLWSREGLVQKPPTNADQVVSGSPGVPGTEPSQPASSQGVDTDFIFRQHQATRDVTKGRAVRGEGGGFVAHPDRRSRRASDLGTFSPLQHEGATQVGDVPEVIALGPSQFVENRNAEEVARNMYFEEVLDYADVTPEKMLANPDAVAILNAAHALAEAKKIFNEPVRLVTSDKGRTVR